MSYGDALLVCKYLCGYQNMSGQDQNKGRAEGEAAKLLTTPELATVLSDLKRFDRLARAPPNSFDACYQHGAYHDQGHRADPGFEQTSQPLVAAKKARQGTLRAGRHRIRLPRDRDGSAQNRIARDVNPVVVRGRKVDRCIPPAPERFGHPDVTKQCAKRVVNTLGLHELPIADGPEFVQVSVRWRGKCTWICRLRSRVRTQFAGEKIFERNIIIGRGTGRICQGNIKDPYPQSDQQVTYPRTLRTSQLPECTGQPRLRQQTLECHDRILHGGLVLHKGIIDGVPA